MYSTTRPTTKKTLQGDDVVAEQAPERQVTQAEVETRSKERITANGELLDKTLNALVERNIVSESDLDNFTLPKRNVTIRGLRKSIEELTQQINNTTLDDDEQKVARLESSRSVLVTELLYSVTGFVKIEVPKKINSLVADLQSEKKSSGTLNAQKVEQLKSIQSITPQWEALVTNSVDIMKYFREKHDADVTNTFLGMLNESLFLAVNKDTADLAVTELRSGGGTLADEMSEITKVLQGLFRIDLEVLTQPQANPDAAATVSEGIVLPAPQTAEAGPGVQGVPVEQPTPAVPQNTDGVISQAETAPVQPEPVQPEMVQQTTPQETAAPQPLAEPEPAGPQTTEVPDSDAESKPKLDPDQTKTT